MKAPIVRVVGTGEEFRTAAGDHVRNYSRTVPLSRKDAADYLRTCRKSCVQGFVRTLRVEVVRQ